MSYVPLQVKSHFSISRSSAKIEDLIAKAKQVGLSTLALCDTHLFGIVPFLKTCKEAQIKPILGRSLVYKTKRTSFEVSLFCTNKKGWENLLLLSNKESITELDLAKKSEGLLVVANADNLNRNNIKAIKKLKSIIASYNFYIGIDGTKTSFKEYIKLGENLQIPLLAFDEVLFAQKEDVNSFLTYKAIIRKTKLDKLSDEYKKTGSSDYRVEKVKI